MPVQFSSDQIQRLGRAKSALAGAAEAKTQLENMAAALVCKDGRVKSGYLKLVQSSDGGQRMGTRWSRSADASTQRATDMVKSLLQQAYGDSPAVMSALETYLEASSQRLGTQSFVKLVKRLGEASGAPGERLAHARPRAATRLDGDRVATDLKLKSVGLPAHAIQESAALRSLLHRATSSPVAEAERHAVLSALPEDQRTELMTYFDSAAMDRDLAALALHEAQAPGSGAGAALSELRACDTALRALLSGPQPPVQAPAAGPADLPAEVLAPVQAKFDELLGAWQSGRSHDCVALLETLHEQMNEASEKLAPSHEVQQASADDAMDMRSQLLSGLVAKLSDAQAAHAVQMMQQLDVANLLSLGSDVLNTMSASGLLSRYRELGEPQANLSARILALELFTSILNSALSVRLRGHTSLEAPSAQSEPLPDPLAALSAETKSHFWRAFAAEPVLSLAEFEASRVLQSKTRPSDPALLPQWRSDNYRPNLIGHALARLGPLSDLDTARMVQLFMHPASREKPVDDKFVYLLGANAPALLQLSEQQGRVPSDAQIWQTVLGDPVPDDLQGLGAPDLGARLVQQARQRYGEAARASHLGAGGNEKSLAAWLKKDPLTSGLIQGFSLARQIESMEHPDRPLTDQDFFPDIKELMVGAYTAANAFGQTDDIHRWASPTRFVFDDAQAPGGQHVIDPNAQPWDDVTPPVDHPVIEALRAQVSALTGGRPEQTQAVLSTLTQASTSVLRIAATAAPWGFLMENVEHGAYDFRLGKAADGTVQIRICANPGMRFLGELDVHVSAQGQIHTAGMRMWPRLVLPAQWPQFQSQLKQAQDSLKIPTNENPGASLARVRALCDQLAKDVSLLTAPSQDPNPALQAFVQDASEALADAQFDLANALIDRNALMDAPEAESDGPDLMELGQARRLLEAVMAHAEAAGNNDRLAQAQELHETHFSIQPVSVEERSEQELERGSFGSMIRAQANSAASSGADN